MLIVNLIILQYPIAHHLCILIGYLTEYICHRQYIRHKQYIHHRQYICHRQYIRHRQ